MENGDQIHRSTKISVSLVMASRLSSATACRFLCCCHGVGGRRDKKSETSDQRRAITSPVSEVEYRLHFHVGRSGSEPDPTRIRQAFSDVTMRISSTILAAFLLTPPSAAFQTHQPRFAVPNLVSLQAAANDDNESKPIRRRRWPLLIAASILASPLPAMASAPVMALPKAEGRDPMTEALTERARRQQKIEQEELNAMSQKAREIEATQGSAARRKFEQEFQAQRDEKAVKMKKDLEELQRKLLDEGIDPFTDMEGRRQTTLLEKGVDLGEVQGTPFYLEKEWERTAPKRSMKVKKAANRQVIALMVQDLKNRDVDPLEYFRGHPDKSEALRELPEAQALSLVERYTTNLEKYGQIVPPKEGELSALEKMKAKDDSPEAKKAAKEEAKRLKAEAKAAEKASKQKAKEEAKAAKELAKKEKENAKQAAKAAAAAATAAAASAAGAAAATAQGMAADAAEAVVPEPTQTEAQVESSSEIDDADLVLPVDEVEDGVTKKLPIVKAAGVVVALGSGGVALKLYKDKKSAEEEERQRQFKMLIGDEAPAPAPALEEIDVDISDIVSDVPKAPPKKEVTMTPVSEPAPAPEPIEPPKKKRMGLKGVFSKKKNERETDIMALVGPDVPAADFASLLAKTLTFGAPGRFPSVVTLPGGMPMEEFDLETAKSQLSEAREKGELSLEESAEVFANVVNCMLIDIVDLAASSLKVKEDQATTKAINVVVDFMNHAASLYDSVAAGVIIKPVTYGGTLGRSKLEQMYSEYAISGMMDMGNMSDDFDNRVTLLQDVFQISEKKAEGLMMKAVQKNMMKMLKEGKGMEGMEEMMKGMGGMEGMGDLAGLMGEDGEGPNPEQLKEMLLSLKQLKDSGSIPPEELEMVKKQFKESFGSSIDDVMSEADSQQGELGKEDKELLELMKSILDE